ncbi:phage virion morphogenesis protein [Chromobacterium phragmitis]|uniref:phage virion morphogenesis protein n=1 Tax=Chromobacterium phragmitis TaxID=2202141 RepID=UPI000DEC8466|nr:phage virion morphogenesis protein [Chromobacterium phragmitis]AXE32235.1 phage virion morphogenesis protein [Chromobacterium phragmitis]
MSAQRYEDALAGLLANLDGKARRQLAREIARQLRQSQQKRIAAQLNPDGSAFAPRKPQIQDKKGAIRRAMFSKLRTAQWLKTEASAGGAAVGFIGEVERIARVHQLGLRDRVCQHVSREVQYPARELLGLSPQDYEMIRDKVVDFLS